MDARGGIDVGPARQVVPGPGIPASITPGYSNNNLDAVWFDDRLWLAWRSAATHFATTDTVLHVVASDDGGVTWRAEHRIAMGTDVREPRLFEAEGRLHLTFFDAGTSATAFTPGRVHVTRREADGAWREPVAVSEPDTVVWRVRRLAGVLTMSVYRGAATLYTMHPGPIVVELWRSENGLEWSPIEPDAVIHRGGTETEIVELDGGRLVGVTRIEGPEAGWGSDVGIASTADPSFWSWRHDPRKFDSPFAFVHDGAPYLIARRSLGPGGRLDVLSRHGERRRRDREPTRADLLRTRLGQGVYWISRKRTSLWAIDPHTAEVSWLVDLPSRGDTAFAAAVPSDPAHPDGRRLVFNYSSPLDAGRDPVWIAGQRGETRIYVCDLILPSRPTSP